MKEKKKRKDKKVKSDCKKLVGVEEKIQIPSRINLGGLGPTEYEWDICRGRPDNSGSI